MKEFLKVCSARWATSAQCNKALAGLGSASALAFCTAGNRYGFSEPAVGGGPGAGQGLRCAEAGAAGAAVI